jgi:hypothetical protein
VCHCPTCRRDFFPSASDSEDGHACVYTRRHTQNRRGE